MSTIKEAPADRMAPLAQIPAGSRVHLVSVDAGLGLRSRLAALGLITGAELHVIANSLWGPFIVAVRESRIILGRGMAEKIWVK
mgnify:CR=1 FL=1